MTEPWLRGPIAEVHPVLWPLLYSFQQAREDLAEHTAGLSQEQIWARPYGLGSVGFHLRHIAGSTDRLMTYLKGGQLTEVQMQELRAEQEPGRASCEDLLRGIEQVFQAAEAFVRSIDPASLAEPREVGRRRLPTTVAGLLTHIAEHTQRHVGQAISAARLAAAHIPPRPR